jgi:hypothetical protein
MFLRVETIGEADLALSDLHDLDAFGIDRLSVGVIVLRDFLVEFRYSEQPVQKLFSFVIH